MPTRTENVALKMYLRCNITCKQLQCKTLFSFAGFLLLYIFSATNLFNELEKGTAKKITNQPTIKRQQETNRIKLERNPNNPHHFGYWRDRVSGRLGGITSTEYGYTRTRRMPVALTPRETLKK